MTTKEITIKPEESTGITITKEDVKKYLCPKASDAELGLFLKVCASEQLNPFKRECFLVKYTDDQPAAIIIATETFVKAAESCPEYDGAEAGIILKNSAGELRFREGAFLLDEEAKSLVGGWAKVFRKDRSKPTYAAVNIKECMKYTRSGKPTRFWEDMPATMLRKVALSRALRESFPNRFGRTLTTAELEEVPEGQLPPALEKGGKPNWPKFYAKIKSELGLTPEAAHELVGVESFKDALASGWTMERIWDELIAALRKEQRPTTDDLKRVRGKIDEAIITATEVKAERIVDTKTGEIITQDEDLFGDEEKAGASVPTAEEADTGAAAPAEEEGIINLQWLKESQQTLKWTNETMLSFISTQYKVSGKTVTEALNKLTRQQAEDFTKKINEKLEKQSSLF